MNNDYKFGLGVIVCITIITCTGLLAGVFHERVKAIKTCYEAAKINQNINCDTVSKD